VFERQLRDAIFRKCAAGLVLDRVEAGQVRATGMVKDDGHVPALGHDPKWLRAGVQAQNVGFEWRRDGACNCGWQVSSSPHLDLALDGLEMAIWRRQRPDLIGSIHHSDPGVQYLSIRYTERLMEAGALRSVGSRGDSYDNALAESVNGLYKAEVIHRETWRTLEHVELATAEWVDWWNQRRLHGAIHDLPPADYEARYYRQAQAVEAA
jgi:transposase InsO family protein